MWRHCWRMRLCRARKERVRNRYSITAVTYVLCVHVLLSIPCFRRVRILSRCHLTSVSGCSVAICSSVTLTHSHFATDVEQGSCTVQYSHQPQNQLAAPVIAVYERNSVKWGRGSNDAMCLDIQCKAVWWYLAALSADMLHRLSSCAMHLYLYGSNQMPP